VFSGVAEPPIETEKPGSAWLPTRHHGRCGELHCVGGPQGMNAEQSAGRFAQCLRGEDLMPSVGERAEDVERSRGIKR